MPGSGRLAARVLDERQLQSAARRYLWPVIADWRRVSRAAQLTELPHHGEHAAGRLVEQGRVAMRDAKLAR